MSELDRARITSWRVALERWRDLLEDAYVDERISLEELAELGRANPADLLIERLYATFSDLQLESLIRPLGRPEKRARPEELLALRVCGLNCDGEDLAIIDGDELRRRKETVERLRQAGSPSPWLRDYVGRLVVESRRRRGAA